MWTLNSAKTLSSCLATIERAVPNACCKIAVDGGSTDSTAQILIDNGWEVHHSPRGIHHQANMALRHVHTEYYASFEHDILLNPNWLSRVQALVEKPGVAVAQGIRIFKGSRVFEAIETYQYQTGRLPRWFYSLDNTLYRTEIIRRLGGYPKICPVSTDGALRQQVLKGGYLWLADLQCISRHLRPRFWTHLSHQVRGYMYRRFFDWYGPGSESVWLLFKTLIRSPAGGARIASRQHVPWVFFCFPIWRYVLFHHYLHAFLSKEIIRPEIPLPRYATGFNLGRELAEAVN